MRKVSAFICLVVATMLVPLTSARPTMAATVGNSHPQSGRIVSDDPANFTPHILDGTVYSIVQVGDMVVVGGDFTQVRSATSSTVITRNRVFAFNATTGAISTSFKPNPSNTVYKVQAAADGKSVYVGGRFGTAYGVSMPSRLFKANVATGARDINFRPGTFSGDIRDLEVIGNRLWVAGKFTHIAGVAQKALGTISALDGKKDGYFTGVIAGTHRPIDNHPADRTNVLQISSNPTNTRLVAVGNFTSVNGVTRSQIAQFDIGGSSYSLAPWYTSLFTSKCSANFETIMTDVEYSPDGSFFAVSTTAAWGGMSSATGGNGCDVVARFESSSTSSTSKATWTAYTGGDTTWTVEVTDNVVYAGGHQSWQNNPIGANVPAQGAVPRPGIAALNAVNGMAWSWNPTRTRGVGSPGHAGDQPGPLGRLRHRPDRGRVPLQHRADAPRGWQDPAGDEQPDASRHGLLRGRRGLTAEAKRLHRRSVVRRAGDRAQRVRLVGQHGGCLHVPRHAVHRREQRHGDQADLQRLDLWLVICRWMPRTSWSGRPTGTTPTCPA